jgi:hypothetical protein
LRPDNLMLEPGSRRGNGGGGMSRESLAPTMWVSPRQRPTPPLFAGGSDGHTWTRRDAQFACQGALRHHCTSTVTLLPSLSFASSRLPVQPSSLLARSCVRHFCHSPKANLNSPACDSSRYGGHPPESSLAEDKGLAVPHSPSWRSSPDNLCDLLEQLGALVTPS